MFRARFSGISIHQRIPKVLDCFYLYFKRCFISCCCFRELNHYICLVSVRLNPFSQALYYSLALSDFGGAALTNCRIRHRNSPRRSQFSLSMEQWLISSVRYPT